MEAVNYWEGDFPDSSQCVALYTAPGSDLILTAEVLAASFRFLAQFSIPLQEIEIATRDGQYDRIIATSPADQGQRALWESWVALRPC